MMMMIMMMFYVGINDAMTLSFVMSSIDVKEIFTECIKIKFCR